MADIAAQIEAGRTIASKLEQFPHAAHQQLAGLSGPDMAALEAFRANEMSRLVATVESSKVGADIRFAAAKAVYRATLAANLKITPEAIRQEEAK